MPGNTLGKTHRGPAAERAGPQGARRSDRTSRLSDVSLVAGIDPGRATAATVASLDGAHVRKLTPGRPMRAAEKRLAYLQRQLDRQRRRNNPDCYRPDGTWIKGKRAARPQARGDRLGWQSVGGNVCADEIKIEIRRRRLISLAVVGRSSRSGSPIGHRPIKMRG